MTKGYHQLIISADDELTESELKRKRFCESIPPTVLSALTFYVEEKRRMVMEIEKDIDEILDFLNGFSILNGNDDSHGGDAE